MASYRPHEQLDVDFFFYFIMLSMYNDMAWGVHMDGYRHMGGAYGLPLVGAKCFGDIISFGLHFSIKGFQAGIPTDIG